MSRQTINIINTEWGGVGLELIGDNYCITIILRGWFLQTHQNLMNFTIKKKRKYTLHFVTISV